MDLVPLPKPRLWMNKTDFFRPFRTAAAEAGENILPLYDPALHPSEPQEPDLADLNAALLALVDIFPDVQPEVFREMLLSVSAESRLQIVTEHLLSKEAKWIRGRYRTPKGPNKTASEKQTSSTKTLIPGKALTNEQTFRSDSYKKAVKQVLYQEFRNLSHSSIKAILAEQNFSYTLSRPVLQQISSKPWRFSLSSFWTRRSPFTIVGEHPFITWQSGLGASAQAKPAVKRTGSAQLDQELHELFVAPILTNQQQNLLTEDFALAAKLNEEEAEQNDALFDCECCYGSVTFENLSVCDDGCHQLCFDCVRRTVSEALYGQGWARTVDLEKSTARCFASTTHECRGVIPSSVLRRALYHARENESVWNEFQERAVSEVLTKSCLPLQRCPFCNYVEVSETSKPCRRKTMAVWYHITNRTSIAFQLALSALLAALLIFTVPIVLLGSALWLLVQVWPPATRLLFASWTRVSRQRRGLKFTCRNPACSKTSCVKCTAQWRDPHVCFENEKTSLRTAIESSATAAVKRTCPKCMLSFVKSSGCNKLVCNCGYTMCYICRQAITNKENYSHFCNHFRPQGGRCTECERCDLYGDEDEDAAIRRATEEAEKAWREQEGGKGVDERTTQVMVDMLIGRPGAKKYWESWLDAIVDAVAD